MLPHRCLLARAAFGALSSSSLVYAAHHRPRRATLTRLSRGRVPPRESHCLRGLVTVLSAGVVHLVDSGYLQMAGDMRGCLSSRQVLPPCVEAAGACGDKRVCGWVEAPRQAVVRRTICCRAINGPANANHLIWYSLSSQTCAHGSQTCS